jgi:putative ABC transport system substrate-binding protein
MNSRRRFLVALGASAVGIASRVQAQTPGKISRVGVLASSPPAATPELLNAFREGLRELGYVEGRNIAIEVRWTDGSFGRLPEAAAEVVGLNVDVILARATPATIAAGRLTPTIPIVFVGVGDPMATGLVASLARPGANVTGVTNLSHDLSPKLVELLVEVVPRIRRIGVLRHPGNQGQVPQLKETETAVRSMRLQLHLVDVHVPEDFDSAFTSMVKAHATGAVILPDPMVISHRHRVAELAIKNRLPTVFGRRENAEAGGLIAYGPSIKEQFRRAASFVDKILKGARPGDLPIEQPSTFELAINIKTAKALGVTIPRALLTRADRVIE